MVFELRYRSREGQFETVVSFKRIFPLPDRSLATYLRSRIESWTKRHGDPVVATVEFSTEEWRQWTASDEFTQAFITFHEEWSGRSPAREGSLAAFFGCHQVIWSEEVAPAALQRDEVES